MSPLRTVAPTLTSARTTLKPLGEADLWTVHAMWTNPDVRRHLWDDVAITPERAREVLQAGTRDFRERHYGLWGIHEGPADALAGFVGCRPWATGEPELVPACCPRGGIAGSTPAPSGPDSAGVPLRDAGPQAR
ncbi:MAG: hypothetical protein R2745_22060 [Vicinamibacterales bacterium]